jgi:hypothetical protein
LGGDRALSPHSGEEVPHAQVDATFVEGTAVYERNRAG